MHQPDKEYAGTILEGEFITSSKGTAGYRLLLETEDGEITHVIWITHKTLDRAKKDFETIGADVSQLSNASYVAYGLAEVVKGKKVNFMTKEESYNGRTDVKVAYLMSPREPVKAGNIAASVASMFAGSSAQPEIREEPEPFKATMDDIPF